MRVMQGLLRRQPEVHEPFDPVEAAEERLREIDDMRAMTGDLNKGLDRLRALELDRLNRLRAERGDGDVAEAPS
jgi:hypothetical protein